MLISNEMSKGYIILKFKLSYTVCLNSLVKTQTKDEHYNLT